MAWTKGQLVELAAAEMAIAGFVFDIEAEESQFILSRLDLMMATWSAKGIQVGYAFPSSGGGSDGNDASGLPDMAVETVATNLAKRCAPSFGKVLSPQTLSVAEEGYATLLWNAVAPQQQQYPNTLPRGAGSKPWRMTSGAFMPTPDPSPLTNSPDGGLSILE